MAARHSVQHYRAGAKSLLHISNFKMAFSHLVSNFIFHFYRLNFIVVTFKVLGILVYFGPLISIDFYIIINLVFFVCRALTSKCETKYFSVKRRDFSIKIKIHYLLVYGKA